MNSSQRGADRRERAARARRACGTGAPANGLQAARADEAVGVSWQAPRPAGTKHCMVEAGVRASGVAVSLRAGGKQCCGGVGEERTMRDGGGGAMREVGG